jgi:hypothetical protein
MGVGAEISQGMFGTAEGALGIDDPVVAEEGAQPCSKPTGFSQLQEAAMEVECCLTDYLADFCSNYLAHRFRMGAKKCVGLPLGLANH